MTPRQRIPCPLCNSPQPFPRRRRRVEGLEQIFIACTKCPWEVVLHEGEGEVLDLELDVARLAAFVNAGRVEFRAIYEARATKLAALRSPRPGLG